MSTPDIYAAPEHVAIIMDGNGRWAAARGLPRAEGHRRGVEALRRCVRAAGELGIKVLTIYSFSTENWSRPKQEISDLMMLIKRFVREDLADLHKAGVCVRMIGDREGLDPEILKLITEG
jgi:undecaprenyl diphosphate synthase